MHNDRREFIKAGVAAALTAALPGFWPAEAGAETTGDRGTPIRIIVPRDYIPPVDGSYAYRLGRSVLDFVQDHYGQGNLPLWGRPLVQVDLEKRVVNIVYWVLKGVREHQEVHPVDPAWVMAQIMAESFFNEFAVSPALAVGVCQFVAPTARSYDMQVAGDVPGHHGPPHARAEGAGMLEAYYRLRQKRRELIRENRRFLNNREQLRQALEALVKGRSVPEAAQHLAYLAQAEKVQQDMDRARQDYRDYLRANFAGRSIFNPADVRFLVGFDERVTYKKPVTAMVHMLAQGLRVRNGNILAAAAGYNAGLSSTIAPGLYQPFGRIPSYEETVTYISRVVVNHHAITRRL
ncbi:MAG: transglycosylase SLT domain-containing protein [Desulfohalobiaceae bacterium]